MEPITKVRRGLSHINRTLSGRRAMSWKHRDQGRLVHGRLNLTSGAVSACLDRLERAGHITRTRDSADRRVVHLHYNPAARALARQYFTPLARGTEAARRRFTAEQLETVAEFLGALNHELAAER